MHELLLPLEIFNGDVLIRENSLEFVLFSMLILAQEHVGVFEQLEAQDLKRNY